MSATRSRLLLLLLAAFLFSTAGGRHRGHHTHRLAGVELSLPWRAWLVGSTRQGRFSEKPAHWIYQQLKKRDGIEARLLDLRDFPMPFFDQPVPPAVSGRALRARRCEALDRRNRRIGRIIHWTLFGELHIWEQKVTPGSTNGLCEPALVQLAGGELLMIMRTGTSHHWKGRSRDGGRTWDPPRPSPLKGHNTPTALWRLDQRPGEIIAIWNNSPTHRHPLSVAISPDGGPTWSRSKNVAESNGPQVSYPGIVQTEDGSFAAVWQQQLTAGGREIRWSRFTREWVLEQ